MGLKQIYTIAVALFAVAGAEAQTSRLGHGIGYEVTVSGSVADGEHAPFWLSANRYGLSSAETESGYLRAAIGRSVATDSARRWRLGYGVDLAVPVKFTSSFVVQQLYADVQWRDLRLSVGAKERAPELKNAALSSGGMTFSANARPIPQVRLELPDFWAIPGTHEWLAVKGHVAYGRMTDGRWQESHIPAGQLRTKGVLYHSKAGFLRIGNEKKFPLTFTGGLEMYAQFGGEAWNVDARLDDPDFDASHVKMGSGLKSFWNAFVPGGSDATDGNYANSEGNQLGSWHFSLSWQGEGWSLRGYAEHYFEDHSQMFLQYGWKDMLWGVEAHLPRNRFVSAVVYEHLRTTDQSGPIYHDATDRLPIQLSGVDNYYSHNIYGGWSHWGQAIGNPLLVSPIYNADGTLHFYNSRITAHHIGISGQPLDVLGYRALFTHIRSLGTYGAPAIDPQHGNYLMLELNYAPRHFGGFSFTAALGTNGGDLLGNSTGGMLSVRKTGLLR